MVGDCSGCCRRVGAERVGPPPIQAGSYFMTEEEMAYRELEAHLLCVLKPGTSLFYLWQTCPIDCAAAYQLHVDDKCIFLDLRNESAHESRRIEHAAPPAIMMWPARDQFLKSLVRYGMADNILIVYHENDAAGKSRGVHMCALLKLEYDVDVKVLVGGLEGWEACGYPTHQGDVDD